MPMNVATPNPPSPRPSSPRSTVPRGTLDGFGVVDVGETARPAARLSSVDPVRVGVWIEVWIEGSVVGALVVPTVDVVAIDPDPDIGPRVTVVAVGTSDAAWMAAVGVVGEGCTACTVVGTGCGAVVAGGGGLVLSGVPQSDRLRGLGGWPSMAGGGA
jgi:hypothetical protein